MASKVNVKFVAMLAAGLVGAFLLVVGAAYFLLHNSPADLERMGDKAMAKQRYGDAATFYSKAVDREKANVTYITKWRDALASMKPETALQYREAFGSWVATVRQLAMVQPAKIEPQLEYLDLRRKQFLNGPFDRTAVQVLIQDATTLIDRHAKEPGAPWDRLKKFRGIARLRMAAESPDATQQQWDDARTDLEAAIAADPTDIESAVTLSQYWDILADRAEKANQRDLATKNFQAGTEILANFLKANPTNPLAILSLVRRDMVMSIREFQIAQEAARNSGKAADLNELAVKASKDFTERAKPKLDEAVKAASALPPAKIDSQVVGLLRQMEQAVDGAARLSRTQALLASVPDKDATPDHFMMQADIASELNDFPRAIAAAQKILDLPPANVSLEGGQLFTQKAGARYLQVIWSVKAFEASPADQKDAAMTRVREFRQKLAAIEAADSPPMMLAEAWVAAAERKWEQADRLLSQYNIKVKAMDSESMMLWAQIAVNREQQGTARDRLQQVISVDPGNVRAAVALAELEKSLQNYSEASVIYERLSRLYPDSDVYRQRLAELRAVQGLGAAPDPVAAILIDADKLRDSLKNDPASAAKVAQFIEDRAASIKPDPRLFGAMVNAWIAAGQRDKASAAIQRGLLALPDDATLKMISVQLTTDDPVDAQVAVIEQSSEPPFEKALGKYTVLKAAGRNDKAAVELDAMRKLDPESKKLLEIDFLESLGRRDLEAADKLVEKAVRTNADSFEGKTYRARVAGAKGDNAAAISLMQEVLSAGAAQPETWRLLGRFQMAAGRPGEAVSSYRRALEIRPTDPPATIDLLGALVAAGMRDQALSAARSSSKFIQVQANPEFLELWLSLEQELGDRDMVRDRRERITIADPRNRANWGALADNYMRGGDFDKARTAIDKVRELGEDLYSVNLDANWHWGKKDPAKARQAFEDFIAKQQNNDDKFASSVRFAQFLFGRDDQPGALAVLEKARSFQDPKTLQGDKMIADLLFNSQRYRESAEILRAVVAAGADTPESSYRKRLVETLMRANDFAAAEQELTAIVGGKDPDMVSMLLQADIKAGMKDRKGARAILDRAVSRFPNEYAVFVKRGQFFIGDETTLRDAVADLTKAIQLNPTNATPLRLRAATYNRMPGDESERAKNIDLAIADLKAVAKINPNDDDTIMAIASDLISLNRDPDAEALVTDALNVRPRDAAVFEKYGSFFASAKKNVVAIRFFDQAFALKASDGIAQKYLDALLSEDGLDVNRAERLLSQLGQQRLGASPGLSMALAKVRYRQGRNREAGNSAIESLKLLDVNNPDSMMAWNADMQRMLKDPKNYKDFLTAAINQGLYPAANEWMALFRPLAGLSGEPTDEALAGVKALLTAKNNTVRLYATRAYGAMVYQKAVAMKDTSARTPLLEESVRVLGDGVKVWPNDPEMLNNLVFILAKDLGRCPEASALVPQVEAVAGENAEMLDTVGYIHLCTDKPADAEKVLRRALRFASTPRTAISTSMHLSDALIRQNTPIKVTEARELLARANTLAADAKSAIDDQLKSELAAVQAKLPK